ncbi:GNAT family N-acetyltransferase [Paraherbaspirillum soli]|uniref:GNAT family N-acetyltransferase n=1 Tax=Paraherbaspirillum soli TaxID=631222 RepID=A0ABW0M8U7_9BURK
MNFTESVTLAGEYAKLEPLSLAHHDELVEAVQDGDIWKLWFTSVPSPAMMRSEIERRLDLQRSGSMLPFTVRRLDTGKACGMSTYMNVDAARRRVEIGSTWYAASAQRTAINTECKLLLLAHAFNTLDCIAVEFRTNRMNHRSRAAIERLGAKQDGILRNVYKLDDGSYHDGVVFSIIDHEWPTVRRHLVNQLEAKRGNAQGG